MITSLDILATMDNLLSFLYIFWKNLARLWGVSERFWLERWSLEYDGVSIMPRATNLRTSTVYITAFSKEKTKQLTCFLFIHFYIFQYNVEWENFPLIISCCCFRTVLWCKKSISLLTLRTVRHLWLRARGQWLEREGKVFKIGGNGFGEG